MILAIDTGNTHTVLGCINDAGEVVANYRIPTDRSETDCCYAAKIKSILDLAGIDISGLEGVILSSVVPSVTRELKKAVKMITGHAPYVLGDNTFTGLDISSIPGGMIAPDLEACAVAAKELYALPSIIIDMGTATTVTIVDENGAYIGGAILPGAGTALNALIDKTSLLPAIELVAPKKAIAVDTIPSMQSGIVYGSAGAIDGILEHFIDEMKVKPGSIVATGGLGRLVGKYCKHEILFDDDMLLKGLYIIYKKSLENDNK